jgi:hypothetical protein
MVDYAHFEISSFPAAHDEDCGDLDHIILKGSGTRNCRDLGLRTDGSRIAVVQIWVHRS